MLKAYAKGGLHMQTERYVRLFRNGRNQAIRIPREFELEGKEAIIRKEGNRLIVEPVTQTHRLVNLLKSLSAIDEKFPEIDDPIVDDEDIF
jgi:antitoxin VapB